MLLQPRSLGLCVEVLAFAVVAVGLWAWTASAATARPTGKATPPRELGGIVSDRAVGPIPFGSSGGQVIAWAGKPGFTSRPGDPWNHFEIPRHDKRSYVISYSCKNPKTRLSCYTLFGFLDDKLVAFKTQSVAFAFPNGVKPGMTDLAFQKRQPKAKTVAAGCPGLFRLPSPAGTPRYVNLGPTRGGYFPSRWGVVALYAFSGHPVFTLVFKLKDGDYLCG